MPLSLYNYSLKVVITQYPIVSTRIATTVFESGVLSYRDTDLLYPTSHTVLSAHEQYADHPSPLAPRDNHDDVCWNAQKRENTSSCLYLFIFKLLSTKRNYFVNVV